MAELGADSNSVYSGLFGKNVKYRSLEDKQYLKEYILSSVIEIFENGFSFLDIFLVFS